MEEQPDSAISPCVISLYLDEKCPTDLQREEKKKQPQYRMSNNRLHSHEVWTRVFRAPRHSEKR